MLEAQTYASARYDSLSEILDVFMGPAERTHDLQLQVVGRIANKQRRLAHTYLKGRKL
jgi:hypothetical protein